MTFFGGALMALKEAIEESQKLEPVASVAHVAALILETKQACEAFIERGRLEATLPIKLEWTHVPEDMEFIARVPAKDHLGEGFLVIHACERPGYCDRGKFHVLIEPEGVAAPDDQEAFPRFYFRFENLHEEMTLWVNERLSCKAAIPIKGEK